MDIFTKLLSEDLIKLAEIIHTSHTLSEVCETYGYSNHGRNTARLRKVLLDNDIDCTHFRRHKAVTSITYDKICPNCNKSFTVKSGRDGDKKVCCTSICANKYFSWKQGGKNYIGAKDNTDYRDLIFSYLTRNDLAIECIVCKEPKVLDVHHIDEDKTNNSINNLVILCPTHHYAYHRYGDKTIVSKISEHIENRTN